MPTRRFQTSSFGKIVPIEGDLKLDQLSEGSQLISSLYHHQETRKLRGQLDLPKLDEQIENLTPPFVNPTVFAQTQTSLGTFDRIVIPWGTYHLKPLEKLLQTKGFKKFSSERILFTNKPEIGHNEGDLYNFYNYLLKKSNPCTSNTPHFSNNKKRKKLKQASNTMFS